MSICTPETHSPSSAIPSAAATSQLHPAPSHPTWTHSPELAKYTDFLVNANLDLIGHRLDGLKRLYLFTRPQNSLPEDQVRTCATILSLPFLRISKKVRTNLINAQFVTAGRSFNRYLACTKSVISQRLSEISEDDTADPTIRRLASAVKARTAAHLKVEHAELIDVELPAHLLPQELDTEPDWMSEQYISPNTAPTASPTGPQPQHQPQHQPQATPVPTVTPESTTQAAVPTSDNPDSTAPATPSSTQVLITAPANAAKPPQPRGKPFGMPGTKRGPFKKRRAA